MRIFFLFFPFRALVHWKHRLELEQIMAAGEYKLSCNRGRIGQTHATAFPHALCRQMAAFILPTLSISQLILPKDSVFSMLCCVSSSASIAFAFIV